MDKAIETQELTAIDPGAMIQGDSSGNTAVTKALPAHLWQPGQSGNPSGRPKHDFSAKLARLVLEKEPDKLQAAVSRCLYASLKKGDIKAFKTIAERAYGKLPQPLEHTGQDGGAIEIIFGAAKPQWIK